MASDAPHLQPSMAKRLANEIELPGGAAHEAADTASKTSATDHDGSGCTPGKEDVEFNPAGINRIEAFYAVFGRSWLLWSFWGTFTLWNFAYALSSDTTSTYLTFAESSFSALDLLATIAVVSSIVSAVSQPFWAKWADLWSRHWALLGSLVLYTVGYAATAGANNASTLAAGQVLYSAGNAGMSFLLTLIVGDLTSLRWRGLVNASLSLVYVPFSFLAASITSGIELTSWRWGYGMFCIIMPVCVAPTILMLLWADRKAKKAGVLTASASSVTYQVALSPERQMPSTMMERIKTVLSSTDAMGLLLLGFSFALLLSPPTLEAGASGGWDNPSMIGMFVTGGVLFIAFCLWEWKVAAHPIMPLRVLNRTFLLCLGIDFIYFLTGYLTDVYWSSWLYVVTDYSTRDYTYMTEIETVTLCIFGVLAGVYQAYTGRYKYLQVGGLAVRCIGSGINYYQTHGHTSTVVIFFAKFLLSAGGGISVVGSQVASQGSVKHKDLAVAIAILALWTSIGGAIGEAASGAIWDKQLPIQLAKYVPSLTTDQIAQIAADVTLARTAEPRAEIIEAFNATYRALSLPALILVFVPVVMACFTVNYKLDARQNVCEDVAVEPRSQEEVDAELREIEQAKGVGKA